MMRIFLRAISYFRDDLPRNPVGCVLKYQLRDDGVTPATWDREAAGVTFERR